jgi:beta-barrel assembly-enhancing protease
MKLRRILAVLLLVAYPISLFALSMADERKYGRQIYVEIARSAKLSSDPYLSIYMGIIRDRLESSAVLPFPIRLTLIQSGTLDAFASVGGYVFVTEGMLEECDKEEEIAGVLAHEFGHVLKRHVSKGTEKEKLFNWGTMAAMLLAMLIPSGEGKAAVLATGVGAGQAAALKYSREAEEEADRVGIALAEKAGYSGLGSAEFLKKLRASGLEKSLPQYLLTHPYSDERIGKAELMATMRKTTVDDSLFPFVAARARIVGKPLGNQNEEIWLKRFQKDPDDPVNMYCAALIYSMKGDAGKAEALLRKMESPHRSLFMGEFLVSNNRFKEAVDALSDVRNPIGLFYLGRAYEGLGNTDKAAAAYRDLIAYAGSYPEIYQRLAMVLGRAGLDGGGYEYLGRYYLEMGKDQQAKMNLEKAVSKYGINSSQSEEILRILDSLDPKKQDKKGAAGATPGA